MHKHYIVSNEIHPIVKDYVSGCVPLTNTVFKCQKEMSKTCQVVLFKKLGNHVTLEFNREYPDGTVLSFMDLNKSDKYGIANRMLLRR